MLVFEAGRYEKTGSEYYVQLLWLEIWRQGDMPSAGGIQGRLLKQSGEEHLVLRWAASGALVARKLKLGVEEADALCSFESSREST